MREQQAEPSTSKQAEVTMADILALPDELRTIVTEVMRQREAGLTEIAACIKQDEDTTRTLLAELVAQGFVQEIQTESVEQRRYQVRLAAKRGRALPLDL